MLPILVSGIFAVTGVVAQSYTLQDTYAGSNFFDKFDFFTGGDPTNGFVDYLSYNDAVGKGLIPNPSTAAWGVDNSSVISTSGAGRSSVRISSKASYNHGLFIADVAHMPDSTCGLWPAYWLLGGGTWPAEGELDIIEGVNSGQTNLMSGHTTAGCTITNTGTGNLNGNTCTSPDNGNVGCSITNPSTNSYGTGFNNVGGGVYAVDWSSGGFEIWFFPRASIPNSISSGNPNPKSDFGAPVATFTGSGCDFDSHFQNMQIIVDTTFCGDWAGAAYSGAPYNCPSSCVDYVANNPSAFDDAYWSFNSIKVYQASAAAAGIEPVGSSSYSSAPVATTASTSTEASASTSAVEAPTTTDTETTTSSSAAETEPLSTAETSSTVASVSTTAAPAATSTVGAPRHRHGHHHTHSARRRARSTGAK